MICCAVPLCMQLGDVHAQLGSWSKASEAWSSAVDALLGVYHVVDVWRTKLDLGSGEQQLRRYGVHGLLLAVSILGKLARWAHWCVWEPSDIAHLGARPTGLLARSAALHLSFTDVLASSAECACQPIWCELCIREHCKLHKWLCHCRPGVYSRVAS